MKKILLIDDEQVFRVLLQSELEKNGWQVLEASDGEEGLKMALQERPQVVVCDLLMPRTNGYQVVRTLRAQPDLFPGGKIIVTSSSGYDSDRRNALQAGADEYLVKPVKPGQLLKVLETLKLDGAGGTKQSDTSMMTAGQGVRLKFWGVRGSIPTPGPGTVYYGGNTSCVEVRADGELIILDSGTGIRSLGLSLAQEYKDQPIHLTLLITHTHWDHIQGFPFFPVAYNPKNSIRVLAFEGMRASLEATLSSQMESPYFPISMQQMPGNIVIEELKDKSFTVGGVKVEATFTNHPGITACYKLTTRGGVIVYVPDNELLQRLRTTKAGSNAEKKEAQEFARERDHRLSEFIRGADVVIMDCQYDCTEYPKYVGWGHSCVDDSVALAVEAGVKHFYLFHHDPTHDDAKITAMVEDARALAVKLGGKIEIDAAREGLEVVLKAAKG
jgi:phosphoribosyl 1,2-cyclic phosphodiesterase